MTQIAPQKPKNRFPKQRHLLRHADFEQVYKQGRRHFAAHMTVFYLRRDGDSGNDNKSQSKSKTRNNLPPGLRVGFTVGRVLGGAVERNRIKRRLREAVRLRRSSLLGAVDIVINPKKSILTLEFAAVLEEVGKAFDAITKRLAGK